MHWGCELQTGLLVRKAHHILIELNINYVFSCETKAEGKWGGSWSHTEWIIRSGRAETYRSIPFITPFAIPFLMKMNRGAAYSLVIAFWWIQRHSLFYFRGMQRDDWAEGDFVICSNQSGNDGVSGSLQSPPGFSHSSGYTLLLFGPPQTSTCPFIAEGLCQYFSTRVNLKDLLNFKNCHKD